MRFLILLFILIPSHSFAISSIEKIALSDDLVSWLNDGKSFYNWENLSDKEIFVDTNTKTFQQIYYEYDRNVFASEKKYKNLIQTVYSTFSSIKKNSQNQPIIVSNIDYTNHFYANGLSVNEAELIQPNQPVKLMCFDFKMLGSGDMVATCSMMSDPFLVYALNKVDDLDVHLPASIANKIKKGLNPVFYTTCKNIDSINYKKCLDMISDSMKAN